MCATWRLSSLDGDGPFGNEEHMQNLPQSQNRKWKKDAKKRLLNTTKTRESH
jgi:hypothetical protein